MPRLNPTRRSAPSAISPATSMALGPDAAMTIGIGRFDANPRRVREPPPQSTSRPSSSAFTARIEARISASVAGFLPIVLADV